MQCFLGSSSSGESDNFEEKSREVKMTYAKPCLSFSIFAPSFDPSDGSCSSNHCSSIHFNSKSHHCRFRSRSRSRISSCSGCRGSRIGGEKEKERTTLGKVGRLFVSILRLTHCKEKPVFYQIERIRRRDLTLRKSLSSSSSPQSSFWINH